MKFTLNLASQRFVNRRALQHGFVAAFLLLFLVCAWSGYSMLTTYQHQRVNSRQISNLQRQLNELRGGPTKPRSAEERAQLEEEFQVVHDLLGQDAFRWTELLDRMEQLVPQGVSLVSFSPNFEKNSLALGGRAQDLARMRSFLDRLNKKGEFEDVQLKSHTRVKVKDYTGEDRQAISFSIQLLGVF